MKLNNVNLISGKLIMNELINEDINSIDWDFVKHCDINLAVYAFYNVLEQLTEKHTPLIRKVFKYPKLYSPALIALLKKREHKRTKWRRSKLETDYYEIFSNLRSQSKQMIKEYYNSHVENIQDNINKNVKIFWAYSKSKRRTNAYPTMMKLNNETAKSSFFQSTY